MDWVLSHLQSEEYSAINQKLASVREQIHLYNENVSSLCHILEEKLTSLAHQHFPGFATDTSNILDGNFLNIKKLIDSLFLKEEFPTSIYDNPLKLKVSNYNEKWYITSKVDETALSASQEKDANLLGLAGILKTIRTDQDVRLEFDKLKIRKDIGPILKQFTEKLESLILDIEAGDLLQGYCKLGY